MMFRFSLISLTALLCRNVEAFSPLSAVGRTNIARPIISQHDRYAFSTTALNAAADGKKKRRRKQAPAPEIASPNEDPSKASLEKIEALEEEDDIDDMTDEEFVEMDKVAKFKFKADGAKDVTKGKCLTLHRMESSIGMLFCYVLNVARLETNAIAFY
jgi:hypothetical protein